MNKTLLLIICDFLLISLLALANFDMDDPSESLRDEETITQADPESDVLEMLKKSLEEERRIREELSTALDQTQASLAATTNRLSSQEETLEETQRRLREREEEARRLAAERAALATSLETNRQVLTEVQRQYEQSRTNLLALQRNFATTQAQLDTTRQQFQETQSQLQSTRQAYDETQSKVQSLAQELQQAQSESRVNEQLVSQLEQQLSTEVARGAAMEEQILTLDQQREAAMLQSQQLSGQLQVVQTESKLVREQLDDTRQRVAQVQTEKEAIQQEKAAIQAQTTTLAKNVGTLADTSVEIKEEIRQSRPLTPNTIFNQFTSNRLSATFQGIKAGLFSQDAERTDSFRTILFRAENQIYAVVHLSDIPMEFFDPPAEWRSLFLTLRLGTAIWSAPQLRFIDREPRVLLIPVSEAQARQFPVQVYPVAQDLFKFEEAVLVGATESYYGECSFQIDPETPGYMRMQKERFGRIFGKFVPSEGDLVFSKQGELIGVMANDDYCLVLSNLQNNRAITLGRQSNSATEAISGMLRQMYYELLNKPGRLR